ncbi:response regulator [Desulfobaculum bizertense]|nr:response regulator [Desulfobaculum bizertense]
MEIFSSQLKSLGLKVSEAYSGMQAVEFIKNHGEGEDAVEVAFIDWKMAGMDGLETAGAIQRLTTLEQKPAVVIFTAYDRSLARQHGQGLDIDAYLDKPVNSSDLVDVLICCGCGA